MRRQVSQGCANEVSKRGGLQVQSQPRLQIKVSGEMRKREGEGRELLLLWVIPAYS